MNRKSDVLVLLGAAVGFYVPFRRGQEVKDA
jgi:hypothetical protein